MRFSTSGFFHGAVSPSPEYPIRQFQLGFENLWRYSQLKVHHWCMSVSLTQVANGKNLQSERFNYFIWPPVMCRWLVTWRWRNGDVKVMWQWRVDDTASSKFGTIVIFLDLVFHVRGTYKVCIMQNALPNC